MHKKTTATPGVMPLVVMLVSCLSQGVHWLAGHAHAFDALRWLLEWGYHGQYALLRRVREWQTGPVVDIGCGTGIFAHCFARESYTGVDINAAYVAAARRKYPGYTFLCGDATSAALPASHFNVAVISGVLHHMDDACAGRVLAAVARMLMDNGTLVIWEDVATRHAWNVIGRFVHVFDEGRHIRSATGYRALLEGKFVVAEHIALSSGFMDYCAFICHRRS
ncbi:MAG: class I SAM-dependent methyltransferase [Candidatus Sumerlaeota bacterium]|nr:class I SAM-dependent methyltransferase [Candidatus Sumerlaeota bacterium]